MKKSRDISSLFPPIIVFLALVIAAAAFFSNFKLEKIKAQTNESAAARENKYLAFDRWLGGAGREVIVFESGGITELENSSAATALIFSSSFDWRDCERLYKLVSEGAYNIAVFIDGAEDKYLSEFLGKAGIEYQFAPFRTPEEEPLENDGEEPASVFDDNVYLLADERQFHFVKKRVNNSLLFVTGEPFFMQNFYLNANNYGKDAALNADTAWALSGALTPEGSSVVVFRSKEAAASRTTHAGGGEGFLKLFLSDKRSFLIIASLFFVIFIGFCIFIPTFGRAKPERVLPGQSIKTRFLHEALFLKHYGALSLYEDAGGA